MELANQNAMKFRAVLDEQNIRTFRENVIQQSSHPIIFNTQWEMDGRYLPVQVIFDDTIYVMVRVLVMENVDRQNMTQDFMAYLKQINQRNRNFKYTISEPSDIILKGIITADSENFDIHIVLAFLQTVLQCLQIDCADIIQHIYKRKTLLK